MQTPTFDSRTNQPKSQTHFSRAVALSTDLTHGGRAKCRNVPEPSLSKFSLQIPFHSFILTARAMAAIASRSVRLRLFGVLINATIQTFEKSTDRNAERLTDPQDRRNCNRPPRFNLLPVAGREAERNHVFLGKAALFPQLFYTLAEIYEEFRCIRLNAPPTQVKLLDARIVGPQPVKSRYLKPGCSTFERSKGRL